MVSDGSTVAESRSRLRTPALWVLLVVVLVAMWMWLAFSSGGHLARHWLLPFLALGVIGLAVSSVGLYPQRPRQLPLLMMSLFGCFTLWTALSAAWADSRTATWLESGRLFGYLLVFALATAILTHPVARKAFRYLLIGAALFILAACIWALWTTDDYHALFTSGRLTFPVSLPNSGGALFLMAFWPLMWLAAGTEERAPVRGVALGLATGMLGLAIMTQSRGAVWSLAISAVIMFIVCPARLRTLFYLFVPGFLMVYEFPSLNRFWAVEAGTVGGGSGARTLLVASLTAGFIGMILALLERWIKVSRRMKVVFGSIVFAGVLAALIYGAIVVTSDVGGPAKWLSQTWEKFTQEAAGTSTDAEAQSPSDSRFFTVDSGGRTDIWRVAWQEFETSPIIGVGAGNFAIDYYSSRTVEVSKPAYPHSLLLQVLAETGVVGGVLFAAGLILGMGGLLWPRCVAGWRRARTIWLRPKRPVADRLCNPRWGDKPQVYGWQVALFVALAYWLTHGSVEILWQTASVSVPAFLFLAAGLSELDTRTSTLWPRLSSWLGGSQARHVRQSRWRREGSSTLAFRVTLIVFSALLVVFSVLPYVSMRLEASALDMATADAARAADRTGAAHWFFPMDPSPYLTQATVFETAAREAAISARADRSGAVLDDLALAIERCQRAVDAEPADWSVHHRAGLATLNLLLATRHAADPAAGGVPPVTDVVAITGLHDWSTLPGTGDVPAAGMSTDSLATDELRIATAHRFRSLSQRQLAKLALEYLDAALERNPLSQQIRDAAALADRLLVP